MVYSLYYCKEGINTLLPYVMRLFPSVWVYSNTVTENKGQLYTNGWKEAQVLQSYMFGLFSTKSFEENNW